MNRILTKPLIVSVLLGFLACKEDEIIFDESKLFRDQTLMVDGIERQYHIFVPKEPENRPLVILLHGHGGSHDQSIGDEGTTSPQKVWLSLADQNEFIVVFANGTLGSKDSRGWNDCRADAVANPPTDDSKFMSQLMDEIKARHNHNDKKVFVAGVSNGGSMTQRLAEEIPEKITAFACIVNQMSANSECVNSTIPVSALFMNGTDDPIVPYGGGDISFNRGKVKSTDETVNYWVQRNGTNATPTKEEFPDIDKGDDSTVEKFTYGNGTNNTEVVLFKVIGGGHNEPSLIEKFSNAYLLLAGRQNKDIEMADEIWEFFKNKTK